MSPTELTGARPDDDQVMTLRQWWERNSLSKATAWRIIAAGEGPEIINLTRKRRGVTYGADRRWKAARTRTVSTATA